MNEYSRNVTQIHLYTKKKKRDAETVRTRKGQHFGKCKINEGGRFETAKAMSTEKRCSRTETNEAPTMRVLRSQPTLAASHESSSRVRLRRRRRHGNCTPTSPPRAARSCSSSVSLVLRFFSALSPSSCRPFVLFRAYSFAPASRVVRSPFFEETVTKVTSENNRINKENNASVLFIFLCRFRTFFSFKFYRIFSSPRILRHR